MAQDKQTEVENKKKGLTKGEDYIYRNLKTKSKGKIGHVR